MGDGTRYTSHPSASILLDKTEASIILSVCSFMQSMELYSIKYKVQLSLRISQRRSNYSR